jgi:hypothetical protein
MSNSKNPRWENWFFRTHSHAELADWTARMRFFRFCRAVGGFALDGGTLRCILRVGSEAELIELTGALGIPLHELPADAPAMVRGQTYTMKEMRKFRTRMEAFPRFEQLGWITLASVECMARVSRDGLDLQLSGAAGDSYEVSEADVANAIKIEAVLDPFAERVLQPPPDNDHWFRG